MVEELYTINTGISVDNDSTHQSGLKSLRDFFKDSVLRYSAVYQPNLERHFPFLLTSFPRISKGKEDGMNSAAGAEVFACHVFIFK